MGHQASSGRRLYRAVAAGAGSANLDQDVAEVTAAVMSASRLFVALSARALADIDATLTLPQLRTLVVLENQGPIKLAVLASTLAVNPSTAMRMVDKLEAIRLVDRQSNPDNRREVVLRLTEDGHQLVERVQAHRHAEIAAIVGRLPAEQRTGLVHALRALVIAADEPAVDPLTGPVPYPGHS
jgi:DNA-binding MarR family transcriptional regulator